MPSNPVSAKFGAPPFGPIRVVRALGLAGCLILALLRIIPAAQAGGTWAALAHAPPAGLNNALLLGDGTVVCGDGGNGWYRLAPDARGSYVNGAWTILAASHYTRLFYSSQVLTNGSLYVAGGEYGTGKDRAEVYNPGTDTWTDVLIPASDPTYSDAASKMLPNGTVLQGTTGSGVWIYNPLLNTITAAASSARGQDEVCWVKLANDTILTIDSFGTQTEHYVPSLNQWYNDGDLPVALYGFGGELGAGFLLPNGKAFYLGATTHTAIYTPGSTITSAGTWVAGPDMVFGGNALGAVDAPAAMLVNGKILCALGPTNDYVGPISFYEYDYVANAFTAVNGPTGPTFNNAPFVTSMLALPDGSILFISGQGSRELYIYFPDGSPLAAGQPVINSIVAKTDGTYHLTGLRLNGLSAGAAYGDDWQMDSNYPLVRLTNNASGNVYYARAYGWNSTGVMTGARVVTTEFELPAGLPAGNYSLIVSANGNPSAPQTFAYSPPAAPAGLTARIGNSQLALSWPPVPGATAYNLRESFTSGANFVTLATVAGANYTCTGLTNGVNAYFVVTAVTAGGSSAPSPQLTVAPSGPPPVPAGLTAGPDNYPGVNLVWNASPGASSYNLKRAATASGPFTTLVARSATDYNDASVAPGTTYYYAVSAVSGGGESADSGPAQATPYGTGDVTAGLVANWRLDETTGSTTADASGNQNTGTLVNGPARITPGRIGAAALAFVATNNQSVTMASSASLNMTTGLSITAWIKAVDWAGNRRILQKGNSDNQYRLLAENGAFKFNPYGVGTLTCPLPATNVWVHVAATWNGGTMALYTNGSLQASQAATGSLATTGDPLVIGAKNGSGANGDYFNGWIDEIRVYNRGLSAAEINTVIHAGEATPTTPTGVRAAAANTQAIISWNAIAGASSYNVKRSNTSGGPYQTVGAPFSNTYTDCGLSNGVLYYYVVSAVNSAVQTANSGQVSARPGVGVTFFSDANYGGGASQLFTAGSYTLSQLQAAGVPNDTTTSCRIPNGWKVTIYQDDNFGGAVWNLNSDTPNFALRSGLNDNMSSCAISTGLAPAAPGGFSLLASNAQVSLAWNAVAGAGTYDVLRSLTNRGPFQWIAATTETHYTDTGLLNGTNYFYVISTFSTNGQSANSIQLTGTPLAPPEAPANLSALAGNAQVQLAWDPSPAATSYRVQRSTNSGSGYTNLAAVTGTRYLDGNLANGTAYFYVVSAINAGGESPVSLEATATPFVPVPVQLISGAFVNGQYTFQFAGIDGRNYVIQVSTNLIDWLPLATNQPNGGLLIFADTSAIDTARFYRVQQ